MDLVLLAIYTALWLHGVSNKFVRAALVGTTALLWVVCCWGNMLNVRTGTACWLMHWTLGVVGQSYSRYGI